MLSAIPQRWLLAIVPYILTATAVTVSLTHVSATQPPADEFALGAATTEPVTATEQLKSFSVPQGFRIQLVAAEPQLAKPMNLAFDARGRLLGQLLRRIPLRCSHRSPGKRHHPHSRRHQWRLHRRQIHGLCRQPEYPNWSAPMAGRSHLLQHPQHLVPQGYQWRQPLRRTPTALRTVRHHAGHAWNVQRISTGR
ncbi:MAG UNVERIFIED_CONTAM: hypothetical protein LVR18_39155 [Planctomycetaceae bacterium]